jgi:hypothetical protein
LRRNTYAVAVGDVAPPVGPVAPPVGLVAPPVGLVAPPVGPVAPPVGVVPVAGVEVSPVAAGAVPPATAEVGIVKVLPPVAPLTLRDCVKQPELPKKRTRYQQHHKLNASAPALTVNVPLF